MFQSRAVEWPTMLFGLLVTPHRPMAAQTISTRRLESTVLIYLQGLQVGCKGKWCLDEGSNPKAWCGGCDIIDAKPWSWYNVGVQRAVQLVAIIALPEQSSGVVWVLNISHSNPLLALCRFVSLSWIPIFPWASIYSNLLRHFGVETRLVPYSFSFRKIYASESRSDSHRKWNRSVHFNIRVSGYIKSTPSKRPSSHWHGVCAFNFRFSDVQLIILFRSVSERRMKRRRIVPDNHQRHNLRKCRQFHQKISRRAPRKQQ